MKRLVQVTMVGYFEIDEADLETYEATTFERAVEKQTGWFKDDPSTPFEEIVDTSLSTSTEFKLMPEDFSPTEA